MLALRVPEEHHAQERDDYTILRVVPMYIKTVRLTRRLFWCALVAGILAMLFPHAIPWWIPAGIGVACLCSFLAAANHVVTTRRRELRCPNCGWVPFALNAWQCKKCRQVWDTFSTDGACPNCHHRHEETVCVRCRRTSKNTDWQLANVSEEPT